ncbi:hypothetical protein AAMO2058_000913100 [Amorphochlora amoebiformis]
MASHSAEPALMTRTSPGSEEEDEYEDCYLILDLDCSENRNFTREVKAYSIQDLLSSPAVIHLDGKEMRGDHQDTIGTSLIFEQGKDGVSYVGKTFKKIRFSRWHLDSYKFDKRTSQSRLSTGTHATPRVVTRDHPSSSAEGNFGANSSHE